jgi:hypothetical protein
MVLRSASRVLVDKKDAGSRRMGQKGQKRLVVPPTVIQSPGLGTRAAGVESYVLLSVLDRLILTMPLWVLLLSPCYREGN